MDSLTQGAGFRSVLKKKKFDGREREEETYERELATTTALQEHGVLVFELFP